MKKNAAAIEGESSLETLDDDDLELGILAALEETSDAHVVENEDIEISHESKRVRIKEPSPSPKLQDQPLVEASCTLCTLPEPLLLRITCFLSPEDVLSFALTCRHAHTLASDDGIWRRLYYHRWPAPCETSVDDEQPNWKTRYLEADRASVAGALSGVRDDASLRALYASMAIAKRSEVVDANLAVVHGGTNFVANTSSTRRSRSASERIATFRARLREVSGGAPVFCGNVERDQPCCYVPLGSNVWACSRCGVTHICDANCALATDAGEGELLVCPISGRCLDLMVEGEEEADAGATAAAADDWNADETAGGGRLGRAFLAGYNANSKEMLLQFGVSIQ